MGFSNGYDAGYDDAKAELMPKIKALEAQLASAGSAGSSGGQTETPVTLTEPTVDADIDYQSALKIIAPDASEIVAVEIAKMSPGEGDDYYVDHTFSVTDLIMESDDSWNISDSCWVVEGDSSEPNKIEPSTTYRFTIFWRAATDTDSSIVRMTVTGPVTMPSEDHP